MGWVVLFGVAWTLALGSLVACADFSSPDQRQPPVLSLKDTWSIAAEKLDGRFVFRATTGMEPSHIAATVDGIDVAVLAERRGTNWSTTVTAKVPNLPALAQYLNLDKLTRKQRRQLRTFRLAYCDGQLRAVTAGAVTSVSTLLDAIEVVTSVARRSHKHPWTSLAKELDADIMEIPGKASVLRLTQTAATITVGAVRRDGLWHTIVCGPRLGTRTSRSPREDRARTAEKNLDSTLVQARNTPAIADLDLARLSPFEGSEEFSLEVSSNEVTLTSRGFVADVDRLAAAAQQVDRILESHKSSPYR